MSADPLDGREVECSNAVDHGLVECHAGRSPFFPLQFAVVEQVDDRRELFRGPVDFGLDEHGAGADSSGGDSCYCGGDDVAWVDGSSIRHRQPRENRRHTRRGCGTYLGLRWPELFSSSKIGFWNGSHL